MLRNTTSSVGSTLSIPMFDRTVRAQARVAGRTPFRKTDSGDTFIEAIRRITSDTMAGGPLLNETF
jgi:hypothetical protein